MKSAVDLEIIQKTPIKGYLKPKQLGGANFHREQCLTVPDILDPTVHAVHLNPCHKKFTLIISTCNKSKNRKMLEDVETVRLKGYKKKNTATDLFPDVCYFCKMKMKKVKGQISYCYKLTSRQVAEKIQEVAELKEDYEVLKDIKGANLLDEEFQAPANVNISGATLQMPVRIEMVMKKQL